MDNFNNQIATQRLRLEVEDNSWPDRVIGNHNIVWKKEKESRGIANYVPYYKGYNIDTGGYNFANVDKLRSFISDYILSNQLYNKLKFEPEKKLDEDNNANTNAEELARVKDLIVKAQQSKDYSVMTGYENRIKLLELIVYLEKKLGQQLSVMSFGENFGKYIREKLGYTGPIKVNKTGAIINRKDIADTILSNNKKS